MSECVTTSGWTLYLCHTHTLSSYLLRARSLSLSLSLSITHTHNCTFTHTHTHTPCGGTLEISTVVPHQTARSCCSALTHHSVCALRCVPWRRNRVPTPRLPTGTGREHWTLPSPIKCVHCSTNRPPPPPLPHQLPQQNLA
jgi:hypothetical protein